MDDDTISVDSLAIELRILEERENDLERLTLLPKMVRLLHTSLLYYRNLKSKRGLACYDTWKTLVKKVGGTENFWRDFGSALGIPMEDLDYINHAIKDDHADIVLKVFTQNDAATLDKILDTLIRLERYDIVSALEDPITRIAESFKLDEDSGYVSSNGTKQIISCAKNLIVDLPTPLLKNEKVRKRSNERCTPPILDPSVRDVDELSSDRKPTLLLTFAEDGLRTAYNIQHYVNNWEDVPGVTVVTLNDRRDEVYQNPEKFIREYFEKADFVVPVVTSGYLREIRSYNPAPVPNTNDNLDFKYVNFIYNLIVTHYIHANGCLNKKVRSVIPQNGNLDVIRNISMYPDLIPWTQEKQFDKQFKTFLRKKFLENN